MTRLDTIATRQRTTRVRDAIFAACLAVAAIVSLTSVETVAHATTSHVSSIVK